jgi:hypothetical protein
MLIKRLKKIWLILIPFVLFTMLFSWGGIAIAQYQPPTLLPAEDVDIGGRGDVCIGLADKIRTGDIHLRHIPCFVKFFTQTIIGIAGSLAVVFVMIGGYRYVIGPDEQKDAAKKTITYALIGLAVALLAWIITDVALQLITE